MMAQLLADVYLSRPETPELFTNDSLVTVQVDSVPVEGEQAFRNP